VGDESQQLKSVNCTKKLQLQNVNVLLVMLVIKVITLWAC